jgi:hypothetical protein
MIKGFLQQENNLFLYSQCFISQNNYICLVAMEDQLLTNCVS